MHPKDRAIIEHIKESSRLCAKLFGLIDERYPSIESVPGLLKAVEVILSSVVPSEDILDHSVYLERRSPEEEARVEAVYRHREAMSLTEMRAKLPQKPEPPKETPDLQEDEFTAILRRTAGVAPSPNPVQYKAADPNDICSACQGTYVSHPKDMNHHVQGVSPLRRVCCEDVLIFCGGD